MAAIAIEDVAAIGRREAPSLAAEEYRRVAALAAALTPDEWDRPTTDCPGWTVRDVLAHVAGSMAGTAMGEGSRQRKLAQQRSASSGRSFLDEMNQLQIAERADVTPEDLSRELRARVEPAVRARRRVPGLMRRMPIPGAAGRLTLGKLLDVILTRDAWMHRMDVCRATGRAPELTPAHDGRLVADVVREWAGIHGHPFTLRLTGPAGGTYVGAGARAGPPGPDGGAGTEASATTSLELDAVDFCRTLSGREPGAGLLATTVAF